MVSCWVGIRTKDKLFSIYFLYILYLFCLASTEASAVTLVSPNGSEVLAAGSDYSINWTTDPNEKIFNLYYSTNNGVTWKSLAKRISNTQYHWRVPPPVGNKMFCLMKIRAYNASGRQIGRDRSNGTFSIEVVKILSPKGGEKFYLNYGYDISWVTYATLKPVAKVRVELTTDGGLAWRPINTDIANNPGVYWWLFKDAGNLCKVRVVLLDRNGNIVGKDTSDNFFSVVDDIPVTKQGHLIIGPGIANVSYKTAKTGPLSEATASGGAFEYFEGENITFSIGDLVLGTIRAKEVITPLDFVPGAVDAADPTVTNICRFLQSISYTGSVDAGLSIYWKAEQILKDKRIIFAQSADDFGRDPEVQGVLDALTSAMYYLGNRKGRLMSAEMAQRYLNASMLNWGKATYPIESDVESGFPLAFFSWGGQYQGGPQINTLVGDIDDDGKKEILVSGLAAGPLWAIRSDGTLHSSFGGFDGVAYPAIGKLTSLSSGLDVVFATYWGLISAYAWTGDLLPEWPKQPANFTPTTPTLADVDNDGLDEIFINEEDARLHAYKANGAALTGWPTNNVLHQSLSVAAIGDLNGDGYSDIVAVAAPGVLYAFHKDGSILAGFPVAFPGDVLSFPVIGDVDGDGQYEIIVGGYNDFSYEDGGAAIIIVSASGIVKYKIGLFFHNVSYGSAPVLADFDADGVPEIVYQTDSYLSIYRYEDGDFRLMPGWPQYLTGHKGDSSPVVGDVDGDSTQEIVVTATKSGSCEPIDEIRVYKLDGTLHPRFPKVGRLRYNGTPAIADIDSDGRNEIVVRAGDCQNDPVIWVYDLGGGNHGKIEWGQFGRDYRHSGFYPHTGP